MNVVHQIQNIVASSLKLPIESVPEDASMDSMGAWDSIAHVNILMRIEQEFDIYLDAEEFSELTSITEIVARIAADGANE